MMASQNGNSLRKGTPSKIFQALLAGLLGSCSFFNPPAFTNQELRGIDRTLTYQVVEAHHRSMAGRKVLVGGRTLLVENRRSRAFVELSPLPLDTLMRPEAMGQEALPVLLIFPHTVDPSVLETGRPITVIGRIRGMRRPFVTGSGRRERLVAINVLALRVWTTRSGLINGGAPYSIPPPGINVPFTPP